MLRRGLDACSQARTALQQLHIRTATSHGRPLLRQLGTATANAADAERYPDPYSQQHPLPHHRATEEREVPTPTSDRYKSSNQRLRRPRRTPRALERSGSPLSQLHIIQKLASFARVPRSHHVRPELLENSSPRGIEYMIELPSVQDGAVKITTWRIDYANNAALERELAVAEKRRKHARLSWRYVRNTQPASMLREAAEQFWFWKFEHNKMIFGLEPKRKNADLARSLYQLQSVDEMKTFWHAINTDGRQMLWLEVMLTTLWEATDKADMVLEATFGGEMGYAAADILHNVILALELDRIPDGPKRQEKTNRIVGLATKLLDEGSKSGAKIRQATIGLLAKKLPAEQVATLYDVITHIDRHLNRNTLLHFASKLGQSQAHKNTAFGILKSLVEKEPSFMDEVSNDVLSSVLTTLLACPPNNDAGAASAQPEFDPKVALEYFMERGFQPNVVSLSAYLMSLSLKGQGAEALRLASLFAEEDVRLDLKGWHIVMRGAKETGDVRDIANGLEVAKSMEIPSINVLSNTLHTVFFVAEKETRIKELRRPWSLPLFRHMLRIYAKRFDMGALQWWIPDSLPLLLMEDSSSENDKFRDRLDRVWDFPETVVPLAEEVFKASSDTPKMAPTKAMIAVMLRAYIKSLQEPYDIMSFYAFFKSKVEARDVRTVSLLYDQGTIIHDAFIMAMTEHNGLLKAALQVFGDMLRNSISDLGVPDSYWPHAKKYRSGISDGHGAASLEDIAGDSEWPTHPPPSTHTYNVVLRGLAAHAEDKMATQVIQVMKENNVRATVSTMNTVIKTYARSQATKETVQALQDLEVAGHKPDHYTYTAFAKLRKQEEALELMEMIIENNRKNLEETHRLQDMQK